MAITTDQGLILPDGGDNANVPLTFTDFVTTAVSGIESRLVKRYLSIADRTARNPAPNEGELAYLLDSNLYQYYDGAAWVNLIAGSVNHQVFTANGVWNKPTGSLYHFVQVVGGGGGGGGAAITAAGEWSFGDGGGGGEYAADWYAASSVGAAEVVTVGTGGAGGAGGAAGSTGGTSSFGTLITCVGGGGGNFRAATTTARYSGNTQTRAGGSGGTGGTIRISGSSGAMGIGIDSLTTGVRAGDGGASVLGPDRVESLNGNGNTGRQYGGGGSGAANSASQGAARTGGAGAPGAVIVTTFF